MPFTVSDFHDLVEIVERQPEWRAELRRLVLTEELLRLPESPIWRLPSGSPKPRQVTSFWSMWSCGDGDRRMASRSTWSLTCRGGLVTMTWNGRSAARAYWPRWAARRFPSWLVPG